MTPHDLKKSILQLAIQGKLVGQISSEGTAEELYMQIQEEKNHLVVEKKIKKEKPLATIKEDEIPFDIPASWKWCRIGEVGTLVRGSGIKRDEVTVEGKPCVRYGEIYTTYNERFETCKSHIPDSIYETCKTFNYGDVVFTLTGENKPDIAKAVAYMGNDPVAASGDMAVWTNHFMNPMFLVYLFASPYMIEQKIKIATGFIIVHISCKNIQNIVIPLPPLAEQNRIVDRIQQLFKLVDRYSESWSKLQAFNQKFPVDMKKSILQQAIQGKLVEQRVAEGTAEELYNQIQAEKKKLVAKKIIKKDKALDIISDDEIPFDIPTTWKWVRIGDIFTLQAGKNISASSIFDEYSAAHPYLCFGGNGIRGYVESANRNGIHVLIGRQGALCGNVKLSSDEFYATEHAVVVDQYEKTNVDWAFYFLEALNLNQYATATAQPGLAVSKINNVLIPLPPFEEQVRIVNKIEKLLPLCDSLIK